MLTYTTYSEAGGVGKTTLSANLARAHSDHGHRVLVVDLDPQDGCLSYLLGVDENRSDEDADTIVHHMIDRGDDFDGLIRTTEGIDVVPSHNMLERLGDLLEKAASIAEQTGESFSKYGRLRHVLAANDIPEKYDVLIVDPPATSGPHLYNAIDATRSLVVPVEPSGKGGESITGLESVVAGIESNLDIDVGVLATVVNRFEGTNDQEAVLDEVADMPYSNPVTLRKRASLFEGCWTKQCSAFEYVDEHRDRERDHERETLDKLDDLAAYLEERGGL
ncbi:ParA family protein (plasmid) [Halorussus salilacus]|uniref:ParA family protein n=1 Tax=Halorussus salilacus TaxID=2953750 RepID=UPI00209D2977|nr:ParA family protein [Halorussus salilacus]USZ70169.1 ParA family protein [Halorussus salilacus]